MYWYMWICSSDEVADLCGVQVGCIPFNYCDVGACDVSISQCIKEEERGERRGERREERGERRGGLEEESKVVMAFQSSR